MKKGFTFIELLVAMAIMGILITIATANFRDFGVRQKVDDYTRTLSSELRLIQGKAAAGVKEPPTSCTGPLTGYQVSFNVGAQGVSGGNTKAGGYTVYSLCPTSPNAVSTVTFPTDESVTINRNPANANFTFKTLQSGTDISSSSPFVITVTSGSSTKSLTITIDATGTIK
jgi:prepilin-type N-terminal cleavage/methylation domain-containing protein